jgi:hypothetical protein
VFKQNYSFIQISVQTVETAVSNEEVRLHPRVKRKIDFVENNDGDNSNANDQDNDPDFIISKKQQKRWNVYAPQEPEDSTLNRAFLSENTTAMLDRSQISSRKAALTFGTVARSIGGDQNSNLTLSHRTIHRTRIKNRVEICQKVSKHFVNKFHNILKNICYRSQTNSMTRHKTCISLFIGTGRK